MTPMPEWWLTASGVFFVLGSISFVVLCVLLGALVYIALDLRTSLKMISHRVEILADKVEGIADQVKSVTTEVGVRTTGITRMVDDMAGSSLNMIERFAPFLVGIGVVLRIAGGLKRRKGV